jgi:phosphatidylglycerol---prolipoprotein diacylglyceryl transferase
MYPIVYRFPEGFPLFGEQAITSFGVLLLAGLLLGGWLTVRRLGRSGTPAYHGWDLVAAAAAGGFLGAKLYYLLLHLPATLDDPLAALVARGGLVWHGALLGGALAAAWRARRLRLPLAVAADAAAPGLALGYGIGRLGSFLVGADYGLPTTSPLGVTFPEGMPSSTPANLLAYFGARAPAAAVLPDGYVIVHPTQLYEAAAAFLLLALLLWLPRRLPRLRSGRLFGLYLLLASLTRAAVEFLRAKDDRLLGPFTLAQAISLALAAAGAWLLSRRGGTDPGAGEPASPSLQLSLHDR